MASKLQVLQIWKRPPSSLDLFLCDLHVQGILLKALKPPRYQARGQVMEMLGMTQRVPASLPMYVSPFGAFPEVNF